VNDKSTACIADFGLARVLGESGFTTKTVGGTWRWMAYELVGLDEEESIPQVTMESDIWAFGMTVLEVRILFIVLLWSYSCFTADFRYFVGNCRSFISSTTFLWFAISSRVVVQYVRGIQRLATTFGQCLNDAGVQIRLNDQPWPPSPSISDSLLKRWYLHRPCLALTFSPASL
jgi:serine/threonine protein kinase